MIRRVATKDAREWEDVAKAIGAELDSARKEIRIANEITTDISNQLDAVRADLRRRDEWHAWPPEPANDRAIEVCLRNQPWVRWVQLAFETTHPHVNSPSDVVYRELGPAYAPGEGTEEGDRCGRNGCDGKIAFKPDGICTCHISPPCRACEYSRLTCGACGVVIEEPEAQS